MAGYFLLYEVTSANLNCNFSNVCAPESWTTKGHENAANKTFYCVFRKISTSLKNTYFYFIEKITFMSKLFY